MKHILVTILGCMLVAMLNTLDVQAASSSDVSEAKPGYGVVKTSDGKMAEVWVDPYASSVQIGGLEVGVNVMIIGDDGTYYEVVYNKYGSSGFVSKNDVEYKYPEYYLQTKITSDILNMREYPGTSFNVVAEIPNGTSFAYVETVNTDWHKGVYGNVTGFASTQYTNKLKIN